MDLAAGTITHIIIGAGTAGCLIANRLSQRRENKVLLLEAGDWDRGFWTKLPVGYYRSINNMRVARHFRTEPSEGTGGRTIIWPRGRVIGGSSSINGLIYIRGEPQNFDDWAASGNPGWSYQDLLPYFRKLENFSGPVSQYHGNHGEVQVSELRVDHPACRAWLAAAREYGLPANHDLNGATSQGVGAYHLSVGKRWRSSSATAFLKPARGRGNLQILTNVLVEKILVENHIATGVRLRHRGQITDIKASAEVILCAGALQSPQLLQLSGIGPAGLLQGLDIPVIHDSPGVGQNLQDHYQMRTIVRLKQKLSLNDEVRNPFRLARMGLEWLFAGRGMLTVGAGQVGGGMRSHLAPGPAPDLQLFISPLSVDKPGEPLHDYSGFTAAVWQCQPASRGYVEITGPDPSADPKIIPNYLSHPLDQKTMIEGVRILRQIYQQPSFRDLWDEEIVPGPEMVSDDQLLHAIRNTAGTVYHPVGTCRMGQDGKAVVGPDLRVHGVENLRVADASVMPQITSANTNAPTFMIAEKAADLILSSG